MVQVYIYIHITYMINCNEHIKLLNFLLITEILLISRRKIEIVRSRSIAEQPIEVALKECTAKEQLLMECTTNEYIPGKKARLRIPTINSLEFHAFPMGTYLLATTFSTIIITTRVLSNQVYTATGAT